MPKRKPAQNKALNNLNPSTIAAESPSQFGDALYFPYARYVGVVGVHSSLLLFSSLFLPRTTMLFEATRPVIDPSQQTSRDRPQHPFLEDLTASPVLTIAWICLGAMVLQAWWGGSVRDWWVGFSLRGTDEERRMERVKLDRIKFTQVAKAWLFTLAASVPLHIIIVMLGAPISSHILQTYFLALLLSVLMFFTPAYTFGLPSVSSQTESLLIRLTWIRLFAEFSIRTPIERAMVYPAVGAALGSWLGAIPIALDWDRPWQAWPLTPAFGAILGYIIASMLALTVSMIQSLADEHLRSQNQKTD
ncbi:Glycosylphosphatidylinositol (GPI) anchor assembly protein [Stygiomarasmius scandens]|uniref:Glycosylphosphatidylinositol (GPI) anchor assembly protein n=1 Tax=Marasmiellus scandens TaxID=2682957 RepID=A0ABR1JYH1_9AGAR